MASIVYPRQQFTITAANVVDVFADRRDLICGQMTSAATATDGQRYEDLQDKTNAEIEGLFGINSQLANVIFQFLAGNKRKTKLDVIPKDDAGAATEAEGIVTFSGTSADADGTYKISIADKYAYTVTVDVLEGDTPTDIGDKLVSALAAYPRLPATAANVTGAVTFTATNAGTVGNSYLLEIEGEVEGITVVLTGFTGGATDPTVTNILDVVGDEDRYNSIVWPQSWDDDLSIPVDFQEARFQVDNVILNGMVFTGRHDTYANLLTFLDGYNERVLSIFGNDLVNTTVKKGAANSQEADYIAAYFAGLRARRFTPDADLSDIVVATDSPNDLLGGAHTASLPYFNTPFALMPVTPPSELFSHDEQKELAEAGFTVVGTNSAKTGVILGQAVTTYKTDPTGSPNESFHFLNYVDTGWTCEEVFLTASRAKYSQSRLTDGDLQPGYSMANAESIKAYVMSLYRQLAVIVLVRAGIINERYVSQNLTVTVSLIDGKVTILGPLPIVTQFREAIWSLQLNFSLTEGQQLVF